MRGWVRVGTVDAGRRGKESTKAGVVVEIGDEILEIRLGVFK
jgi:hypothetical protein